LELKECGETFKPKSLGGPLQEPRCKRGDSIGECLQRRDSLRYRKKKENAREKRKEA